MAALRRTRPVNMIEKLEDRRLLTALEGRMAFGDLNGDGKIDMVYGSQAADSRTGVAGWGIDLHMNQTGTGIPPTQVTFGLLKQSIHITAIPTIRGVTLTGKVAVTIGDVNGDGKADIVVYVIETGGAATKTPHGGVLLGDGKGGFKPGGTFDTKGMTTGGNYTWGMSLADFNGDGRKDLFLYTYTYAGFGISLPSVAPNIGIALNTGAGSFRDVASANNPLYRFPLPAVITAAMRIATPGTIRILGAQDMDGDGKADILCQYTPAPITPPPVPAVPPAPPVVGVFSPTSFGPLALTFSAVKTITLPGDQTATGPQTGTSTISGDPLGNLLPPPTTTAPLPIFGNLPSPTPTTIPLPAAFAPFAVLGDINNDGLGDLFVIRGSVVYIGINRSMQVTPAQRPAIGWRQLTGRYPNIGTTDGILIPNRPPPSGPALFIGDPDGKGNQTLMSISSSPYGPPFTINYVLPLWGA